MKTKRDNRKTSREFRGAMFGKAFIHSSPERRTTGDLYETPLSMTQALLDRESFRRNGYFLEPAAGGGAIVRVVAKKYKRITFYDKDVDFFTEDRHFDYIITNPPYSLADEFVQKAKSLRPKKFAFLLRTNYLSGQKRLRAGAYEGLSRVYVFSRMPDLRASIPKRNHDGSFQMVPNPIRDDGKFRTAGIVYAWMVWECGRTKPPELHFIDNGDFALKVGEE